MNLAAVRSAPNLRLKSVAAAGIVCCLASLVALLTYTARVAPVQLWVLVGFVTAAVGVESAIRLRGRRLPAHPAGMDGR